MSVKQRIRISILLEKMSGQEAYSEKLGLEDRSIFRGERIRKEGKEIC